MQSRHSEQTKNRPAFALRVALDSVLLRGTGNFWDSDVFLHILFLDDHNFINNHPPDLKSVSNDAQSNSLRSAVKIRL